MPSQTEMQAAKFVELLSSEQSSEGHILNFRSEDDRRYRMVLDFGVVGATVDALQGRIAKGPGGDLLTLTVLGSQPLANPEQKGLALRTKEVGSIAFDLTDEAIEILKQDLAKLESVTGSDARH